MSTELGRLEDLPPDRDASLSPFTMNFSNPNPENSDMKRRQLKRRQLLQAPVWATALALLGVAGPLRAQSSRTVRVLVPTGPGGTTDVMLRTATRVAEPALGQSVVLDYKPGAAGIPAILAGLAAPADGSTVIGVYTALAFNPWTYSKLAYDTFKDLDPVSLLVNIPLVLAAGPGAPVATVAELVAYGRANPGKLTIAASGLGGGSHLGGLLLASMGGFDLTVVPYKGGAAALPDVLEGRVSLMLDSYQTLRPHAEAGRLRLLGVSSEQRQAFAPNLPTVAETVPGYATAAWQGLAVRAGTPQSERDRISAAYAAAMRDPQVRSTLIAQGLEPVGSTPAEFAKVIRADHDAWGPIIRKAGLKND
jgi:tripartite-type tricarboxylate transporter receptor subunit TctC